MSAIILPVKAYKPSLETGSVLVVDANEDCVCMCDDAETAAELVATLNAAPQETPSGGEKGRTLPSESTPVDAA